MRSVNQNHHLYVVKAVKAANATLTDVGDIKAVLSGPKNAYPAEKDIYFQYMGRDEVITSSDLIPVNQITYLKHIPATDQVSRLKQVTVTLDSSAVDSNDKPIIGEDYILNIVFQQFYGLSPENTYVKTVGIHVTKKLDTKEKFFKALVAELNLSFSREVGADAESNPYLTFEAKQVADPENSGSQVWGIVITEKEQKSKVGKWEAESLMFDVFPSTVHSSGVEVEWGTVVKGLSNTTIPNSKRMADLEWFTFGERADYYRGMGYPNNFDFYSLVDPDNEDGYDALEIHFAYQGSCEDIQKSEKDITIIGSSANISSLKNTIDGYLNPTTESEP